MCFVFILATILLFSNSLIFFLKRKEYIKDHRNKYKYIEIRKFYLLYVTIYIIITSLFFYDNFIYVNKYENNYRKIEYNLVKKANDSYFIEKKIYICKKRLFDEPICNLVDKEYKKMRNL